MLNSLTVTKDEIAQAKEGMFFELKDGESYAFMVTELKEFPDKGAFSVKTKIISANATGKNYNIYIGNNGGGKKTLYSILSCWFTDDQIATCTCR